MTVCSLIPCYMILSGSIASRGLVVFIVMSTIMAKEFAQECECHPNFPLWEKGRSSKKEMTRYREIAIRTM
jgi:hypothetical protein